MKGEGNLLVRIAAALCILFCVVTIIDLQVRMNDLNEKKELLEEELFEAEEDVAQLEYELNLPYNEDYIVMIARRELGYHFPDEMLFINNLYEE